jgi:hypothetical protein
MSYPAFLIIILGLAACGQPNKSEPEIAPILIPAFAQFRATMDQNSIAYDRKKISDIEVVGAADWTYENIVGICYTPQVQRIRYTQIKTGEKQGKIEILETTSLDGMNVTLVHELGHCIFGLGHSDDQNSIMYPAADYSVFPDLTSALDGLVRELGR